MILTLCMIVRDEAEQLPACLASVAGLADELIVVDTGSSDDTAEIAARAGALVIFEPWADDFAAARNVGLAAASGDWILVLDADEQLAPESQSVIRQLMAGPPAAYQLRIRSLHQADSTLHATEHYHARLFPRAEHIRFAGVIHESVHSLDPAQPLASARVPAAVILHTGYTAACVKAKGKALRNLLLLRKALAKSPQEPFHHFNLGMVFRSMNEPDQARVEFEEVIALCGDEPTVYLDSTYVQLQVLAMQHRDFETAWDWTERGETVCRLNPDYWLNRGTICVRRGRISEGIEAFTEAYELGQQGIRCSAVELSSYSWKPFLFIANAYRLAGDEEAAQLFLTACHELYPELDLTPYNHSDPERKAHV